MHYDQIYLYRHQNSPLFVTETIQPNSNTVIPPMLDSVFASRMISSPAKHHMTTPTHHITVACPGISQMLHTVIFAMFALATLAGCGIIVKFVYPSNHQTLAQVAGSPVTHEKIAVLPFEDYRGDSNQLGTPPLY